MVRAASVVFTVSTSLLVMLIVQMFPTRRDDE